MGRQSRCTYPFWVLLLFFFFLSIVLYYKFIFHIIRGVPNKAVGKKEPPFSLNCRVFQLILVKLFKIVYIIIRQGAPLGLSCRANLYSTLGLRTRIIN